MTTVLTHLAWSWTTHAESLSEYTQTCLEALGINQIPSYSCQGDGLNVSLDVLSADDNAWIGTLDTGTYSVDAVFLCREVGGGNAGLNAIILHNRKNGETCFFDSVPGRPSENVPSPTSAAATNQWLAPDNFQDDCQTCHTSDPFIVPEALAYAWGVLGLMNNKRDLLNGPYHIVGEAHAGWNNDLVFDNASCAGQCHRRAVSTNLPSLAADAISEGWMPIDVANGYVGHYGWLNRDRPGASGDWERLSAAQERYPELTCDEPSAIVARVVGQERYYVQPPQHLHYFSVERGLYCLNSQQGEEQCDDYHVRFMCGGAWTPWLDRDNPSGKGDAETLQQHQANGDACANPTRIQLRNMAWNPPLVMDGPPDDLELFTASYGLDCRNSSQLDGMCEDYQVYFSCP